MMKDFKSKNIVTKYMLTYLYSRRMRSNFILKLKCSANSTSENKKIKNYLISY